MYDALGRLAVRFALVYLRRRYRREIRLGVGLGALALALGAWLATRDVREG